MKATDFDGGEDSMGDRIRQARVAAGLSQNELARRLGLDPATLNRFESSKRQPSLAQIRAIAQELDILMPELLGTAPAPDYQTQLEALRREVQDLREALLLQQGAEYPRSVQTAASRNAKIAAAFEIVRSDQQVRVGADAMHKYPVEAQRDIVRLYERLTGKRLLPPEVF